MFSGRVLSFDEPASVRYAELRANARVRGEAIGTTDGYIAAVAVAHDLAVATRDTAHLVAAGLRVIDPCAVP